MKSKVLQELSRKGIEILSEYEARSALREYGIPCPKEVMIDYKEGKKKESDVYSRINQLKGKTILGEFRGMRPVNMNLLVETTLKLSKMIKENPEMVELDVNPLLVGAAAVDTLIKIEVT
jgi:hypothetical protein